jgi:disulfide bond formation protein DsbB
MTGPSWKHRRRLVYATYFLATCMIMFAMVTYRSDTSVASQALVGAVSLISIILTAYTAFATLDDKWHWVPDDSSPNGKDLSGTEVHYNSNTEVPTDWIDDEV